MRILMLGAVASAAAGGVYFHGAGGGFRVGETYAVSADKAAAELAVMRAPDRVRGLIETFPDGSIGRENVPGQTIWTFHARGKRAATFIARVEPVDAGHARIDTSMEMAPDAEALLKTQMMPMAKQFAEVGQAGMIEQIDATMEGRAFDPKVVKDAMARYAMSNMGEIMKASSDVMDQAAALNDRNAQPRQPEQIPGQPMLDPTVR